MYKDTAKKYLKAGLNPVPLKKGGKIPIRKDWTSPINEEIEEYDFEEIGICTGTVSGGLEGIDFDLDVLENPQELWQEYQKKIPLHLLDKLTICRTVSGGYHVIYRTEIIEGNRKLAHEDGGKVIIETRGDGGYLKCHPSEGYQVIRGDLTKIQKVEDHERQTLITTARMFDKKILKQKKDHSREEYEDPFPEYNSDPDIGLDLLEEAGWTVLSDHGDWVQLARPGNTWGVSACYNTDGCFLYVFSTSVEEFDTEKPISNSKIFCTYKADGNFSHGYSMLYDMGYGKKNAEEKQEIEALSFISMPGEDEQRLYDAIDGSIPMGRSFGWSPLDEYYLYKENSLDLILAYEGVGKTWMVLHKLVALSVLYGEKFGIVCGENDVANVKRIIIEAVSGKDISYFKTRMKAFRGYMDWLYSRFFIFKNDTHYSIEGVLERADKLVDSHDINALFIDPFSFFKRQIKDSYAYTDDLLSKMNIFTKQKCGIFMSVHPNTDATRKPRDSEGYLQPPSQYDAIGGNIFANRSDHFNVYHRIPNHKVRELRRIMEIRTLKVKDTLTGGSVTPVNEAVSLTYKTLNGFTGYWDTHNFNPIYDKLHKKEEHQVEEKKKELPRMDPSADIFG